MTTLIGMQMGLGEASPFIRYLMQVGPVVGLALVESYAFVLCGICIWLNKTAPSSLDQLLVSPALVVWNMALIARVLSAG